jgi:type II secretion system protein I
MLQSIRADAGSTRGFTLIEVLCALVIASLALVSLLEAMGGSQRAARRLQDHLGATILARSILAQEGQTFISPSGDKAGDEGGYHWEMSVLPAGAIGVTAPNGFALYRIVVTVSWAPNGRLQLDTVRLGR